VRALTLRAGVSSPRDGEITYPKDFRGLQKIWICKLIFHISPPPPSTFFLPMVKDKKSEKKAAAPKVKADKKTTTAKVPTSKEILEKAKKAVSTFNYFQLSFDDDVFLQKVQVICQTTKG
jgi:hypothetical protein